MTTFNYLTRAAKDRSLFATGNSSPGLNLVGAVSNCTTNAPYVPVKGYCGAIQNLYFDRTGASTLELRPQNIFSDKYDTIDLNQGNFDLSLGMGGAVTIAMREAYDPSIMPVTPGSGFAYWVDTNVLDRLNIRYMTGTTLSPIPQDTKLQAQIYLSRNKEPN